MLKEKEAQKKQVKSYNYLYITLPFFLNLGRRIRSFISTTTSSKRRARKTTTKRTRRSILQTTFKRTARTRKKRTTTKRKRPTRTKTQTKPPAKQRIPQNATPTKSPTKHHQQLQNRNQHPTKKTLPIPPQKQIRHLLHHQ